MINNVKQLLKKHGYIVEATLDISSCEIRFFKSEQNDFETIKYIVKDDYIEYIGDSELPVKVQCPRYAARLAIYYDIFRFCSLVNYSMEVLVVYKGDTEFEQSDFISQFDCQESTKELELEYSLTTIFQSITQTGYKDEHREIAKEANVLDGFSLIYSIFGGSYDYE